MGVHLRIWHLWQYAKARIILLRRHPVNSHTLQRSSAEVLDRGSSGREGSFGHTTSCHLQDSFKDKFPNTLATPFMVFCSYMGYFCQHRPFDCWYWWAYNLYKHQYAGSLVRPMPHIRNVQLSRHLFYHGTASLATWFQQQTQHLICRP